MVVVRKYVSTSKHELGQKFLGLVEFDLITLTSNAPEEGGSTVDGLSLKIREDMKRLKITECVLN